MPPSSSKVVRGLSATIFIAAFIVPLVSPARTEPTRLGTGIPAQQGVERARVTTPMARCLATWSRATQMSKSEWKATCRRVVKNNPGLYSKPF
jgi:hypothetical protein